MNLKTFIKEKLNEALNEEQKFDFDSNKQTILNFIKAVKQKKTPFPFAYSIIKGELKVGDANKLGFTDDEKLKWKSIFKSSMFYSDGVWSQVDYNPNLTRKLGKDKTLNYYVTISKDKQNIKNFVNSIPDLNQKLKKLSDDKKSPISWKTHTILDAFIGHNDSLKVYYYDVDLKNDIEKTVKDWLNKNKLNSGNRTHVHGADIRYSPNADKQSYGQLLAGAIEKQFTDVIKKYGDKYTDEQYFQWLKINFPEIIKKAKINYN